MKKIINDYKIDKFVIDIKKTIREAILLFEKTNGLPLIALNQRKEFVGILSNGDIRRFLSNPDNLLDDFVEKAINKNALYCLDKDNKSVYSHYLFKENIRVIPILNDARKVVSVAYFGDVNFEISKKCLSYEDNEIYLIAEIGVNHNGDYKEALKLIDYIAEAGFDAVKMQFRSNITYSYSDSFDDLDLSTEYIISEINRTNITYEEEEIIINYIKKKGLDFIGTPFDNEALNRLLIYQPDAIKIASCDLTNELLIKECAQHDLPLILSTGMSSETELISVNNWLNDKNVNKCFLHCNSTYPTPIEDNNLNYINRMKLITKSIIGYSSHNGDPIIPIAAASLGAKIIELHVTSDKEAIGTDHSSSLNINELKSFEHNIRKVSLALGNQNPRIPSQGELINKISLGKSLCYKKNLKKGYLINPSSDLIGASPGDGIEVNKYKIFENKVLKKDVFKLNKIKYSDFADENLINNNTPKLNIKSTTKDILSKYEWGIPVRYRDIKKFNKLFDPPLFEIHLSSKDLEYDLKRIKNNDLIGKKYLVHSIEQFHDGFIFDIASDSAEIIEESFKRIEVILNHCDQIYKIFRPKNKIQVILNCGGFTRDSFLNAEKIAIKEEILLNNLLKIKNQYHDYEFLPQTMPPFPWHQGGRSHHNLLRSQSSLNRLYKYTGLEICLDFSHTFMNCQFEEINFVDEIKELINITKHMHLSDSNSNSSEGLNIGDGKIDFLECFKFIYSNSNRNISFIPEVWQGHLNDGKNFGLSLERIGNFLKDL